MPTRSFTPPSPTVAGERRGSKPRPVENPRLPRKDSEVPPKDRLPTTCSTRGASNFKAPLVGHAFGNLSFGGTSESFLGKMILAGRGSDKNGRDPDATYL
eukprot:1182742-Prorocentrum_minimum.AAC.12